MRNRKPSTTNKPPSERQTSMRAAPRKSPSSSPPMWPPFVMGFGAFLIYLYMHTSRQPKEVLFQAWFQQQGGWMSPSLKVGETQYGNGLIVLVDDNGGGIHKSQKILEIPVDLLMTQESAAAKVQAVVAKSFTKTVDAIDKYLDNPLDQQDVWIALELMLERCNGNDSRYAPYLDMLPTHVPRLATFTTDELDLLQDEEMKQYGLSQQKALEEVFLNGIKDIYNDDNCWTPESFFHSVALSASRAMIIDGKKYLTPMAEMINHADNKDSSSSSFQANHKIVEGSKLVVHADRDFGGQEELVEEYGKLDNSLYISAFGFVPRDNPHHCVMIGGSSVCVKRNGEASDEGALMKLAMPNDCTSPDQDCWKHRDERVRAYLQREAQQKLSTYPTTLEEDQALLVSKHFAEDMDPVKARVAIEFRMEEKKVLLQLARG